MADIPLLCKYPTANSKNVAYSWWQHGRSPPATWPHQRQNPGIQGRLSHCRVQQWRGWGQKHGGGQSQRRCSWVPTVQQALLNLEGLILKNKSCKFILHCFVIYLQSCFGVFVVVLGAPFPWKSLFLFWTVKCRCLVKTREDANPAEKVFFFFEERLFIRIAMTTCSTRCNQKYVLYLAANVFRATKISRRVERNDKKQSKTSYFAQKSVIWYLGSTVEFVRVNLELQE